MKNKIKQDILGDSVGAVISANRGKDIAEARETKQVESLGDT
jgi:hypothetical protein